MNDFNELENGQLGHHKLYLLTVLQYGYAFHAFSSIVSEPFGAIILIKDGTRDSK